MELKMFIHVALLYFKKVIKPNEVIICCCLLCKLMDKVQESCNRTGNLQKREKKYI